MANEFNKVGDKYVNPGYSGTGTADDPYGDLNTAYENTSPGEIIVATRSYGEFSDEICKIIDRVILINSFYRLKCTNSGSDVSFFRGCTVGNLDSFLRVRDANVFRNINSVVNNVVFEGIPKLTIEDSDCENLQIYPTVPELVSETAFRNEKSFRSTNGLSVEPSVFDIINREGANAKFTINYSFKLDTTGDVNGDYDLFNLPGTTNLYLTGGKLVFELVDPGGVLQATVQNFTYTDPNEWHHLTIDVDLTQITTSAQIDIWENGVQATKVMVGSLVTEVRRVIGAQLLLAGSFGGGDVPKDVNAFGIMYTLVRDVEKHKIWYNNGSPLKMSSVWEVDEDLLTLGVAQYMSEVYGELYAKDAVINPIDNNVVVANHQWRESNKFFKFEGNPQYLSLTKPGTLYDTGRFAVGGWFKTQSGTGEHDLIIGGVAGQRTFAIEQTSGEELRLRAWNLNNVRFQWSVPVDPPLDAWFHLVVLFDDNIANVEDKFTAYLNGQSLVPTITVNPEPWVELNVSNELTIGYQLGSFAYLTGSATGFFAAENITSEEVREIYNNKHFEKPSRVITTLGEWMPQDFVWDGVNHVHPDGSSTVSMPEINNDRRYGDFCAYGASITLENESPYTVKPDVTTIKNSTIIAPDIILSGDEIENVNYLDCAFVNLNIRTEINSTLNQVYFTNCNFDNCTIEGISAETWIQSNSPNSSNNTFVASQFNQKDPDDYTLSASSPLKGSSSTGKSVGYYNSGISLDGLSLELTEAGGAVYDNITVDPNGDIRKDSYSFVALITSAIIDLGSFSELKRVNYFTNNNYLTSSDNPDIRYSGLPGQSMEYKLKWGATISEVNSKDWQFMKWNIPPTIDASGLGNGDLNFDVNTETIISARYVQIEIQIDTDPG